MSTEAREEAARRYLTYVEREAFVEAAEWQASRPVTDAEVDAAARTLFEPPGVTRTRSWADVVREEPDRAELWREDARAVLEAARTARQEATGADFDGNEFAPVWMGNGGQNVCPCCAGETTGSLQTLCDGCCAAWLEGVFPHGCKREDERR